MTANKTKKSLINYVLKDLLLTFIISLILLFPITGIILDDYIISIKWFTPLIAATTITIIKLLLSLSKIFHVNYKIKNILNLISDSNKFFLVHKDYHHYLIGLIALILPFVISKYWLTVLILGLIYALLGIGLNIVVGYAGLLDLGYVGFYAVGAYTYAIGATYFNLPLWVILPLGALLAGILGALLAFPVLRMHGDYLAIVTLGFGEIIRLILNNWVAFTNGPNGIVLPKLTIFNMEFTKNATDGHLTIYQLLHINYHSKFKYIFIYLLLLSTVWLTTILAHKLKNMPIGRAWEALRENEIACRSLGIYHVTTKLSAFSIGAAIGGLGGVFFAIYQGFVNPSSFTFFESALILAIVILGGMGSLTGVIIAAIVLTILPEFLREFSEVRMLLFGLLMIIMMIWRPSGFIKLKRPKFNLK